jgi:hypothetical protein
MTTDLNLNFHRAIVPDSSSVKVKPRKKILDQKLISPVYTMSCHVLCRFEKGD